MLCMMVASARRRFRLTIKLHIFVQVVSICLLGIVSGGTALAQPSQPTITQFVHTGWGEKQRAPKNIHAIAQTTDGFLWIAATDGLTRFDGVSFEQYEPPSGPPLPAGPATALLALPNGDLWVGFNRGGISLLRNGEVVTYRSPERPLGGHVQSLAQDATGTIWAGTSTGLARFDGNRWIEAGKEWNLPPGRAGALFVDRQGTLWVVTENTILFLPKGARAFQPTSIRYGQVAQIAEARNGKLWMAETTRSVRPIPLGTKSLPSDDTEVRVGSQAILVARDGSLWITTLGDGLRRVPAPEELHGKPDGASSLIESYTEKDGLTDNLVTTAYQDREGNIWVGTWSGIDCFKKSKFVQVDSPIESPFVQLIPADDGEMWVSWTTGLVRTRDSKIPPRLDIKRGKNFENVYRGPNGAIYMLYAAEIIRYDKGSFVRTPLPKPIVDAFAGRILAVMPTMGPGEVLWMDIRDSGIFYRSNGTWIRFDTPSGLRSLPPTAALTDDSGRVWFGYDDGTIIYIQSGKIHTVAPHKGSPVGDVRSMGGRNQQVWIGGTLGLGYFDGNRVQAVLPSDEERFGSVTGIEEMADGSLWLHESRGVIHIHATELRKFVADPTYRVHYELLDALDGLPGRFDDLTLQKETVDSRGRIWFATTKGIAWLDPASIQLDDSPPPSAIREVVADGKPFALQDDPILPALIGRLEIDYSGLNLSTQERVRFRYQLEGTDKGWQEAGTRREAFYTNLSPGKHRFRLNARNIGGEWNKEDTVLEFSVAPAWFQTYWFFALCAAVAFLIVWALYRMRVRQIANAMSARFDERLSERTRIARDFHDTLLQTIQGSKLVADSALKQSADPVRMRGSMEQLSTWLGRASEEGRAALNSLRSSAVETNDLAEAFRRSIDECRINSTMEASFAVVGEVSEMHPIVRDEVYRIGYEAIRNACVHSRAAQLRVELTYAEDLTLRVRDNGLGIDLAIASEGKEGHFGLQGMRERAGRIMAKLAVETSTGSGTEIKLVVPGSIIYRKAISRDRTSSAIKSVLKWLGLKSN